MFLKKLQPYAVLLLIVLVAYLPVSTFYFGLKNDAFSDNFPNKFFLTEAFSLKHIPLWNPYLNYGFPIYADMGFAFYNPITWVFALIGYNAYTLTAEVLLYIYLGSIFMYRLCKYFKLSNAISITVAAMYICSGFYNGCIEYINFLTAAAFLPLVIQALLQVLNTPNFKNSFVLAIAVYFVFSGGHPAIPVMLVYFVVILLALYFILSAQYRVNGKKITVFLGVAALLFLLWYLPAAYSYVSVLPYYVKSHPDPQYMHTDIGFTLRGYISFLYPFSTALNRNVFGTVATMRNGFFGVMGIVCVLCSIWRSPLHTRVFLITGTAMLLFSAGGPVKELIYNNLPALRFIRYNGEFRVFTIICFCLVAGFGLQRLAHIDVAYKKHVKTALRAVLALSVVLLLGALVFNRGEIVTALRQFAAPAPFTERIKLFLLSDAGIFRCISAAITTLVAAFTLYAVRHNRFKLLLYITVADVCINCLLMLPVTGVGQKTLPQIQAVYNTSPKGIPIPPLQTVKDVANDTLSPALTGLVGDITYYNKKIGTVRLTDYPSFFTVADSLFYNKPVMDEVTRRPYLYLRHDSSVSAIKVRSFNPKIIEVQVTAAGDDTLVYLQNNYPFWHATVNEIPAPISTVHYTFMAIKVNKGVNNIIISYDDHWLFVCLVISLLSLLTALVIIYRTRSSGVAK